MESKTALGVGSGTLTITVNDRGVSFRYVTVDDVASRHFSITDVMDMLGFEESGSKPASGGKNDGRHKMA